jgi:hypothetical protein
MMLEAAADQFKGWAAFLFSMAELHIKFGVEGLWILV